MLDTLSLPVLIFIAAVLYSSVGHAGATGYLAAMSLLGVPPAVMRPAALLMNILVAHIGAVRFYRAGYFSWSLFWPFAVTSAPCAFAGGTLLLPGWVYRPLVGVLLLFAAYRLARGPSAAPRPLAAAPLPIGWALVVGAGLGLLAGLIGIGGGIFLSPLLVPLGWASPRQAAAVSAAFILVNSAAGLAGHVSAVSSLPPVAGVWALAAVAGGLLGSHLGARRLGDRALARILALVLMIAAVKLILTP